MPSYLEENHDSKILQCLSKHSIQTLPSKMTLLSDLELDSLELIETLFELENHFEKTLSNVEIATLRTVGDLFLAFGLSFHQPDEVHDDSESY